MSESFILNQARNNSMADLQELEEADRSRALNDIAMLMRRYEISVSEVEALASRYGLSERTQPVFKLFNPIFGD